MLPAELLVEILGMLPTRDISRMRGVSRFFHDELTVLAPLSNRPIIQRTRPKTPPPTLVPKSRHTSPPTFMLPRPSPPVHRRAPSVGLLALQQRFQDLGLHKNDNRKLWRPIFPPARTHRVATIPDSLQRGWLQRMDLVERQGMLLPGTYRLQMAISNQKQKQYNAVGEIVLWEDGSCTGFFRTSPFHEQGSERCNIHSGRWNASEIWFQFSCQSKDYVFSVQLQQTNMMHQANQNTTELLLLSPSSCPSVPVLDTAGTQNHDHETAATTDAMTAVPNVICSREAHMKDATASLCCTCPKDEKAVAKLTGNWRSLIPFEMQSHTGKVDALWLTGPNLKASCSLAS